MKVGAEGRVSATAGSKVCDVTLAGRPVAMDVSGDGLTLALLSDGDGDGDGDGDVLIFSTRSPQPGGVCRAKYSPPPGGGAPTCRPRDLCFCRLGGQERLVVADWLNDVLLVLHVAGESCSLIGHLGGGFPLLSKPTCVTADDEEGRLWVGCRGGNVLVMQEKE